MKLNQYCEVGTCAVFELRTLRKRQCQQQKKPHETTIPFRGIDTSFGLDWSIHGKFPEIINYLDHDWSLLVVIPHERNVS